MLQRMLASTSIAGLMLVGVATAGAARAADLASVSRLAFGPVDTLFAADWKGGQIEALSLPKAPPAKGAPFNVLDLTAAIRARLAADDVAIKDLAQRPGTDEAYIAVAVGPEQRPAILVATPDGQLRTLDMARVPARAARLQSPPETTFKFWNRTPLRSFTVTDMKWHDGKLYVAGLSNATFASSLRVLSYPFDGKQTLSSIAMYHTSHNQIETRAPIRVMSFATLNGQDTLVASYLCSPLVTIPVAALRDGAHVQGKTIAEFGYGDVANGMVAFDGGEPNQPVPYILITNDQRGADMVKVSDIAAADARPGLAQPVAFGATAGVPATTMPLADVTAIDNQNDHFFVALRRDLADGRLQLVSIDKAFRIRIADFVSEYDFPGYTYSSPFQVKYIKPVVDALEHEEGFGAQSKP